MLRLADVHTYYGESCVLRGVSLEVPRQSVVALLGRNGMGKTTTVHSVIGFVPPRRGEITFKGQSLRGRSPYHIARAGLALVPQGRRLFPSLTVREHLTMAARPNPSGRSWSLEDVYALFPILEQRAHVKGVLLSGGEQQMLSIGRALMTSPDLLLLDEPSEGLAPLVVRELSRIFRQLHHQGLSILLVEQNLPLALATADYVYILSKGMIVYAGTPVELRADEEAQSRYLGVEVS